MIDVGEYRREVPAHAAVLEMELEEECKEDVEQVEEVEIVAVTMEARIVVGSVLKRG